MSIFKKVHRVLIQFKFPQQIFAKELNRLIPSDEDMRIVDVPCGSGEISYKLAENKRNIIEGYDISKVLIKKAKTLFNAPNLKFQAKSIFEVLNVVERYDVVCIVNSLFLLPNIDELLKKVWLSLKCDGKLLIIVPNVKSKNFVKFQTLNPEVNSFIKEKDDLINIIQEAGFALEFQKGIVNISFYGRKELKYMSSFSNLYLTILNVLSYKDSAPSYFIMSYRRVVNN